MEIITTKLQIAKARCETCWRQLGIEQDIITQAKMDLIIHLAEVHEQRHPTHSTQVLIYEKAPETVES